MDDRINSRAARDIAYHLHGYTDANRHEAEGPLVIAEGRGIEVFDENGKGYIDAMAGLWSASLGFSEPRLAEAAAAQMRSLTYYHTFTHKVPAATVDLAERLVRMAPVPMSKVFFASSGSEANDTAVKLVWYYHNAIGRPQKKKIISRQRGYHGVTIASASLTGLPNNHRDFDLPIANILHADCPHHYRYGLDGESEAAFAGRMAESLEQLILREGPDTVAAFIAEPIMGAGGVLLPPEGYFAKVQAILRKYEILFIADEVICGFARTGNMFGSETFGLRPNMMTVAKALSASAAPIAALLIDERLYAAIRDNSGRIGTFGHGFTYSGHPLAAAIALETLKIYEQRDILGHVRRVAPVFQRELRRFADHPLVGEARGIGLIGALELVQNRKTRQPFDPGRQIGPQLVRRAERHGLVIRALGDSIAFCPPLIITETQIKEMFARFGRALEELSAGLREEGLASVA